MIFSLHAASLVPLYLDMLALLLSTSLSLFPFDPLQPTLIIPLRSVLSALPVLYSLSSDWSDPKFLLGPPQFGSTCSDLLYLLLLCTF